MSGGSPASRALAPTVALGVGMLLLLGTQVDIGGGALGLAASLWLGFFGLVFVVLGRIPAGSLRSAEVGTTVFLALIWGILGGTLALTLLEVLAVSSGVSATLAKSIRGLAKGRAIKHEWVVFLSGAGAVALWIALLRTRSFLSARRQALSEALRHAPDRSPEPPAEGAPAEGPPAAGPPAEGPPGEDPPPAA